MCMGSVGCEIGLEIIVTYARTFAEVGASCGVST